MFSSLRNKSTNHEHINGVVAQILRGAHHTGRPAPPPGPRQQHGRQRTVSDPNPRPRARARGPRSERPRSAPANRTPPDRAWPGVPSPGPRSRFSRRGRPNSATSSMLEVKPSRTPAESGAGRSSRHRPPRTGGHRGSPTREDAPGTRRRARHAVLGTREATDRHCRTRPRPHHRPRRGARRRHPAPNGHPPGSTSCARPGIPPPGRPRPASPPVFPGRQGGTWDGLSLFPDGVGRFFLRRRCFCSERIWTQQLPLLQCRFSRRPAGLPQGSSRPPLRTPGASPPATHTAGARRSPAPRHARVPRTGGPSRPRKRPPENSRAAPPLLGYTGPRPVVSERGGPCSSEARDHRAARPRPCTRHAAATPSPP